MRIIKFIHIKIIVIKWYWFCAIIFIWKYTAFFATLNKTDQINLGFSQIFGILTNIYSIKRHKLSTFMNEIFLLLSKIYMYITTSNPVNNKHNLCHLTNIQNILPLSLINIFSKFLLDAKDHLL